jgi:hypothetical protein
VNGGYWGKAGEKIFTITKEILLNSVVIHSQHSIVFLSVARTFNL